MMYDADAFNRKSRWSTRRHIGFVSRTTRRQRRKFVSDQKGCCAFASRLHERTGSGLPIDETVEDTEQRNC
eukprot:scaffold15078_cov248-Alexandrium_tamarense.AAC.1